MARDVLQAGRHLQSPRRRVRGELDMKRVAVNTKTIDAYVESSGAAAVDELRRLAAPLRGLRVLHVNATPVGGGVAEILQS